MSLPKLRNSYALVLALAAAFSLQFVWFEWMVPSRTANACEWTNVNSTSQTNVLLVADPQLIDNHTYPGRSAPLLKLLQHTVDKYVAQNYKAMVESLQPDYIFFLGDYLDNGRLALDAYFDHEVRRFWRIFDRWPAKYEHRKNWFTNVPGNHDIGFGNGVKEHLRQRFEAVFGESNVVVEAGGVDFVILDTPLYSAENGLNEPSRKFVAGLKDANGEVVARDLEALADSTSVQSSGDSATSQTTELVDSSLAAALMSPDYQTGESTSHRRPRILLSHVPLYRDTSKLKCGPLRESSVFLQNKGYQYQLSLLPHISEEILESVRPVVAFSGDDHDYCDVTHPLTNTREITVKSISMAMGIWRPAVQLLSFDTSQSSSPDQLAYDTHVCYLPRPYHNIIVYAITATAIASLLLFHSLRLRPSRYNYSILPTYGQEYSELSAVLMENPMSRKVSNFLKEQDEGTSSSSIPLPAYTSTATRLTLEKVVAKYKYVKLAVRRFIRKWNLTLFLRLCILEFSFVMLGYFVVVTAI